MENGRKCLYVDPGLISVPDAERLMITATALRARGEVPDIILFPVHPRTVALGLREKSIENPRDLLVSPDRLDKEGITLTKSVRGGGITYHWPGQVICYPVMALEPWERNVPGYMKNLEEVGIRTFRAFGVPVTRRRDSAAHVGLWWNGSSNDPDAEGVNSGHRDEDPAGSPVALSDGASDSTRKIASMGVRLSSWVTSFGFAVNVDGDLSPSEYIRPCGLKGVKLVSLEQILGKAPPREEVIEAVKESFSSVFGRSLEKMPDELLTEIRSLADRPIAGTNAPVP